MSSIFNTPLEVSLRVLLTLEASPTRWWSADWISAADFITVYGKDFGITENLHGENRYKYSEFSLRREVVREALKGLVSRCLVDVQATTEGFVYSLGKLGGDFCIDLNSSYAESYRDAAQETSAYMFGKTEREILEAIHKQSVASIQRSIRNG